jgi:predicted phage tail protein
MDKYDMRDLWSRIEELERELAAIRKRYEDALEVIEQCAAVFKQDGLTWGDMRSQKMQQLCEETINAAQQGSKADLGESGHLPNYSAAAAPINTAAQRSSDWREKLESLRKLPPKPPVSDKEMIEARDRVYAREGDTPGPAGAAPKAMPCCQQPECCKFTAIDCMTRQRSSAVAAIDARAKALREAAECAYSEEANLRRRSNAETQAYRAITENLLHGKADTAHVIGNAIIALIGKEGA